MKKLLIVIITVVLLFCFFAGCNHSEEKKENCVKISLSSFPTDKGIYYLDQSAYIKFFDYHSGRNVYLCSKPECTHNTEDCYANINARFIFIKNNELYIMDNENNLVKRKADGSNSSVIMKLCSQYNSSNDSIAYPMSGLSVDGKLYISYDVTILDSKKGEENNKTILTCVDIENHSEKVLLEAENSQYSINNYADGSLYFFEYQSISEDGGLSDANNVNCILCEMDLKDNTVSVVYKDKQINFSPCGDENKIIYFYKNNDPVNYLYSLNLDNPIPAKAEYKVLYSDIRGNIVFDYSDNNYRIEKDSKKSELPLDNNIVAAFGYEAYDGFVFTCTGGTVEGVNGTISEQDNFYITKDDFYSKKNQYYRIG